MMRPAGLDDDDADLLEEVVVTSAYEDSPRIPTIEPETDSTSEKSITALAVLDTAPDAFKAFMNESVLRALSKDYTTPESLIRALVSAFRNEGEFSWAGSAKKTAKLSGAAAIGALASLFVVNANVYTATTLENVFKSATGIDISYANIFLRLLQFANTSCSAALSTFAGFNLIETYLGDTSEAETFLRYRSGTCGENSKKIGRKAFDLLSAIASSVPTFFTTQSSGVVPAALTAAANTAVSWLGVSSLPLSPARLHPAQKIELAYLHEQLETFLKLSPQRQNTILDGIDAMRVQPATDQTYQSMYAHLLNLASPNVAIIDQFIQEHHETPCGQKTLANLLGVYITVSQLGFIEATYAGISRLFEDSTSPIAITAGAVAAGFSVLPNVGFGFFSGYNVGTAMATSNVPLAKLYLEKTRIALDTVIGIIGLFGGGTSFAIAMSAEQDLVNLANLQGILRTVLDGFFGIVSYSTGVIINAYYAMRLCDDILIYLAQRCAEPTVRRLFTFVMETRHFHKIMSETTEENYVELLRWKMTGPSELRNLLHFIFDHRMTDKQYDKTRQDVNQSRLLMLDRGQIAGYQVKEDFAKKIPAWQEEGLRQRKCFGKS